MMTGERVKFTHPKATLSYKARPAVGWKLVPEKTPEKARITNVSARSCTDIEIHLLLSVLIPSLQISKEEIDYRDLVQQVEGSPRAKSKFLRSCEKRKLYPPRLSLRVIHTSHRVQRNLETEVRVNRVKPSVGFSIFAPAPGNG